MSLREQIRAQFLAGYRRGLQTSEFDLALDRLEMITLLVKGLPAELRVELAERLRDTADHIENYGSRRFETHTGGTEIPRAGGSRRTGRLVLFR